MTLTLTNQGSTVAVYEFVELIPKDLVFDTVRISGNQPLHTYDQLIPDAEEVALMIKARPSVTTIRFVGMNLGRASRPLWKTGRALEFENCLVTPKAAWEEVHAAAKSLKRSKL